MLANRGMTLSTVCFCSDAHRPVSPYPYNVKNDFQCKCPLTRWMFRCRLRTLALLGSGVLGGTLAADTHDRTGHRPLEIPARTAEAGEGRLTWCDALATVDLCEAPVSTRRNFIEEHLLPSSEMPTCPIGKRDLDRAVGQD